MISVETVVQVQARPQAAGGSEAGWDGLVRQQHRVAAGTSIAALLRQADMAPAAAAIAAGSLGLAVHGRRAWLDDILADGNRVEIVAPIDADAKAARAERVAADRNRRRARFGGRG